MEEGKRYFFGWFGVGLLGEFIFLGFRLVGVWGEIFKVEDLFFMGFVNLFSSFFRG